MTVKKLVMNAIFWLCLPIGSLPVFLFAQEQETNNPACFDSLYENPTLSEAQISNLRQFKVVFVAGILNEAANKLGLDYFQPQRQFLDSLQIPYEVIQTSSRASEEKNANKVIAELHKITEQNQVLLFTHSRGGVIALRSLLANTNLWPQIAGWIALQTPFSGSTTVDKVLNKRALKYLGTTYLRALGSNGRVFDELSTENRGQYMAEHKAEIYQLLQKIPTVTFGTEISGLTRKQLRYYLSPTRGFVFVPGTDGVVNTESTILKVDDLHSQHLYKSNVSHRDIVLARRKPNAKLIDAQRTTAVLFKALLNGQSCR